MHSPNLLSPLNYEQFRANTPDFAQRLYHEHKKLEAQGLVEFINGRDETEGLTVSKYTRICSSQFWNEHWNPWLAWARGAVFDITSPDDPKLVALPFPKFFNYLETPLRVPHPNAVPRHIVEKCDGSLGTAFFWHGKWFVASSGAPCSPQALWATQFLRTSPIVSELDPGMTYMFEIIYPENRVVVDYGERKDLVLLGCRVMYPNIGDPYPPSHAAFLSCRMDYAGSVARSFSDGDVSIDGLRSMVNSHEELWEGVVVWYSDGTMFKVKSEQYCLLHRNKADVSFNNTFAAMRAGEYQQYLEMCPEEFRHLVEGWNSEIYTKLATMSNWVTYVWNYCFGTEHIENRAKMAESVASRVPRIYRKHMFNLYDGKDRQISPSLFHDYKMYDDYKTQFETWHAHLS